MKKEWIYRAECVRVVDGDTVDLILDLGFDVKVKQRIRLANIDTDELRGGTEATKERARAAKKFVEDKLMGNDQLWVETFQDARGSFGRYLGLIFYKGELNETQCLNDQLVLNGFEKHVEKEDN